MAKNKIHFQKGHPLYRFNKQEIASWSEKHLSPGSLTATDDLTCFPGIADASFDHEPLNYPSMR